MGTTISSMIRKLENQEIIMQTTGSPTILPQLQSNQEAIASTTSLPPENHCLAVIQKLGGNYRKG